MTLIASAETLEVCAAIVKAQAQFKPAKKNRVNPHFKSRYADMESQREATSKALANNGLAILQSVISHGEEGLQIVTRLVHLSGQWIQGYSPIAKPKDNSIHSIASIDSYLRRYGYRTLLCIADGEDDDGNLAASISDGNIDRSEAIALARKVSDTTLQGRMIEAIEKAVSVKQLESICARIQTRIKE